MNSPLDSLTRAGIMDLFQSLRRDFGQTVINPAYHTANLLPMEALRSE